MDLGINASFFTWDKILLLVVAIVIWLGFLFGGKR